MKSQAVLKSVNIVIIVNLFEKKMTADHFFRNSDKRLRKV